MKRQCTDGLMADKIPTNAETQGRPQMPTVTENSTQTAGNNEAPLHGVWKHPRTNSHIGSKQAHSPSPPKVRKQDQPKCGARTSAGGQCKAPIVAGKNRCRLHGGKSTGPRTPEGKAAIAESNRRRAGKGQFRDEYAPAHVSASKGLECEDSLTRECRIKIELLNLAGSEPATIAEILGVTDQVVQAALREIDVRA